MSVAAWTVDEQPILVITTQGQQSTYQIGERIPIDLSFTGPSNKQFEITLASYDRSGRMSYERFDVEPRSGWSDPLATYFGSQGTHMMGGLSSLGVLSPTATLMHLNLNEWVRFDQPGSYSVVVTSHRVSDSLNASRAIPHPSDFTLKSNPIHLTIVPAIGSWQNAKLTSIVNELSTHPATPGIQPPAREAATGDALAIVRQKAESKTGDWACAPQGAALGYLVKFDPASARRLVERAV